jgi:hypothetical protein
VISETLLNQIRATVEAVMVAEAVVYRRSQVADFLGGFTDSYVVEGTYQCSFAPHQVTPREAETTRGIETLALWRFQFPYGTHILSTDRIVTDGRTFEVVDAGSGSIKVAERVICQEIT